jgi:hypothetical protein
MTDEIKQLVYAIKNDGVLNGHDTPNNEWERQIQELIAKARIESYQKGYIDGGIGVMNGELPHKRQFVSKAELALQTKKG